LAPLIAFILETDFAAERERQRVVGEGGGEGLPGAAGSGAREAVPQAAAPPAVRAPLPDWNFAR
jgi:hypothetical protein